MPFSMVSIKRCIHERYNAIRSLKKAYSLNNVTLQVRIESNKKYVQYFSAYHGKKAFLPASGYRHMRKNQRVAASLTLEAALALCLFIFAVVCMILPMRIMNTDRRIQAALEAVGEDYSRYAYLKDILEKGTAADIPGAGEFAQSFCGHLASGAAEGYAQLMVMQHLDTNAVKHVRMLRSAILEDGETFDLIFDYEIQLPFPVLGIGRIERTARCRRRAWIGKPGKDGSYGGGETNLDDEIVYVGKYSTRYHKNRSCHYLDNNLLPVAYEQVADMRNDSGGKYYGCRVCGMNAGTGSTVYIMPSGTSYHTTKSCTAINAYVRAIRLSEAEHLGACSYCSK